MSISNYNRRSRKTKNARRKSRKPRPRSTPVTVSRSARRRGTKAILRKGSGTWCAAHGIPAHGQGKNNRKRKGA